MNSLSLHGVDKQLTERIEKTAQQLGLSINKTVQQILTNALGLSKNKAKDGRFKDLCGVWSEKEAEEFKKTTEGFEKIDPEDWK